MRGARLRSWDSGFNKCVDASDFEELSSGFEKTIVLGISGFEQLYASPLACTTAQHHVPCAIQYRDILFEQSTS